MSTLNTVVTLEDVITELSYVYDPEIGLDIVSLGLVYEVAIEEDTVKVWMTLTTPECPVGPMIEADVRRVLLALPLVKNVEVDFVWDPPWDWTMLSPEAKETLGIVE